MDNLTERAVLAAHADRMRAALGVLKAVEPTPSIAMEIGEIIDAYDAFIKETRHA